ncbi:MAG: hypothetical protein ACRDDX_13340 [Cellulosilyticaceae bacterium]
MSHKIYYFTGTANSLQIAEDLSHALEGSSVHKIMDYKGEMIEASTSRYCGSSVYVGTTIGCCGVLKKVKGR